MTDYEALDERSNILREHELVRPRLLQQRLRVGWRERDRRADPRATLAVSPESFVQTIDLVAELGDGSNCNAGLDACDLQFDPLQFGRAR